MTAFNATMDAMSSAIRSLEGWIWKENPDDSSRVWILRSLFVMEITSINTTIFFLCLIFWLLNRQAHFKPTKGSAVKYRPVASHTRGDDEDSTDVSSTPREILTQRQSESYQSLVEYDTEHGDDSDEEQFEPLAEEIRKRRPSVQQQMLEDVVQRIKIFSYLNKAALKVCLHYVETVDLSEGKFLFEQHKYDGSLYAVLSGEIKCIFHSFSFPEDRPVQSNGEAEPLCYVSGEGNVVTPLLSILGGLVKEELRGEARSSKLSLAPGVSAVATMPNTRVIRLPPRCFAAILERYPEEVHRIAQNIVARVQRTAILTLVKTLGLRKELLRDGEPDLPIYQSTRVPEWKRLNKTLNDRYRGDNVTEESLDESLRSDAAIVAAAELGCPRKECEGLELLNAHSRVVILKRGQTLINAMEKHNYCYLLLRGTIEYFVPATVNDATHSSYSLQRFCNAKPGALVGSLACFKNDISTYGSKAYESGDCVLLKIPKHVFDEIMVLYPKALTRCLDFFIFIISPLVHLLNWNSEFLHLPAAEPIAQRGAPCDSMFIVLSGRLRAKYRRDLNAFTRRVEEFGRGKCIGEISGLTESLWPCNVYAIRNSEVVRVPIRTLVAIVHAFPNAGLHFARQIASRARNNAITELGSVPTVGNTGTRSVAGLPGSLPSYQLTVATVAVVSLSPHIDISAFCLTLVSSLVKMAPTKLMTKKVARTRLGKNVYQKRDAMHDLRMARLLAEMEENYRLVVYQADPNYTWWTKLCIQQADCILLLVDADRAPQRRRVEQSLAWAWESMDVKIDLVVVGEEDSKGEPEDDDYERDEEINVRDELNNWNEQRKWIASQHTVRVPFDKHKPDFHRMCRRITGLSVGVVLGGGGARGLAHLGVLRALMEAGVPIDMVGGTSQGAFVGALYAKSPDNFAAVMKANRKMAERLGSMKEKLLDLTLPMTSMFSGKIFNNAIRKLLGTIRIQDLVINFFCVSVDIQKRKQRVHSKGLLWKYVRASMSLSGYLPPVSEEGSLLVDGGYMNVVPADVMREQFGAQTVIAVDVSPESEKEYDDYGMHLSGWWLLWNSWNPFVRTVKVPSMGDISDSLRWVSSDQHKRRVAEAADLFLSPPLQDYGTLEYGKFDEIVELGYLYAKPIVDEWVKQRPNVVNRSDSI